MNKFFLVALFFLVAISCTKKLDPGQQDLGFGYFPVETGRYFVYDVDVTEFSPGQRDSSSYQIKEVIKDTLLLHDEVVYRVERFYRNTPQDNWPEQPDSVWSVRKDNYRVTKTENNYRYVKLVFPVEEGKKWDGNSRNSFDEEIYTMSKVGKPFTAGDKHYPTSLRIVHYADSGIIKKDYRYEIYAKEIGLVHRVEEIIEYENSNGVIGTDTTGGKLFYQKLREHGKE